MHRCLQLASQGKYSTAPNPLVGSVIVHNGKIIGEGYHIKAGEPHAEINAINSVKDKTLLSQSTLYVNLEPCSHYGKTPPCAKKIAQLKIPRVVIGIKDLSSKVNGKGIEILKNAGIEVITNVLHKQSFEINKRFFTNQLLQRPYIILKWAQTKDRLIDKTHKTSPQVNWITNTISKHLVHKWRAQLSAILIGKNTAIKDNPSLNTREWFGYNPIPIILTHNPNDLPSSLQLFKIHKKVIILNHTKDKIENNIHYINTKDKTLSQTLTLLYKQHNIYSLMVEGGTKTLNTFINNNLWDETKIFTGSQYWNNGIKAPEFPYIPFKEEFLDNVLLQHYSNSKSLSYENLFN